MLRYWIALGPVILAASIGCGAATEAPAPAEQGQNSSASTSTVGSAKRTIADEVVAIRTSQGTIKIRLHADKAPITVDNFLAQVDSGFYVQTIFHQVEPGYMVLAGGFSPALAEKKSRYTIVNESKNGLSNRRGTVAMARSPDGTDSTTGQFFINAGDNVQLDRQDDTADGCGYCVFGEVIEGMDVVDRIAESATQSTGDFTSLPVQTVLIEGASRIR